MKLLLGLLFVVAINAECPPTSSTAPCTANACSTDCSSLCLCAGGQYYEASCSDQTSGKKTFCDPKSFQCSETDNCSGQGGQKCDFRKGKYPDLLNCKKYFYCDGNKNRFDYTCDAGNFEAKNKTCHVGADCLKFTPDDACADHRNQFIPHPENAEFYIYCNGNNPVLFVCDEGLFFDPELVACDFMCTKEGSFLDPKDSTKQEYYTCIWDGDKFIKTKHTCNKDQIFDETEQTCVAKPGGGGGEKIN